MDGASNWIPRRRIRVAIFIALFFAAVAVMGAVQSPWAFLLLIPAAGASVAAFIMLRIRHQLSAGWQQRIHDLVTDRLALAPDATDTVLDIGCGDASLLATVLRRAPDVAATGIDFWGSDWDYAQTACEARLPDVTFRKMDAGHLDFPDASFDRVTSVMCFHEVPAREGAALPGPLTAVAEALRVLKPGGRFVLIDRFRDTGDYGDPARLDAILAAVDDLRRERLVATLGIPWPLNTKRSLGPVDVLTGRRPV
ncbi:class I SAM-dependent methyltransferase [Sphingomonas panacisoli]|uniref:Class I SAM-dependent methyltransferase n=1 Tax=Sphingomonas panacisoli TaxID=1813879 RepID=A0A5B8LN12_9SPHN|nr:class I SAM-dependent methyltransferase [Sphingomonas panacisoli]QDZ08460.1 class I SAM-dependent methyltransferase [Sphingomonas panacisoli]